MKMKKALALLLVALAVSCLLTPALAAEVETGEPHIHAEECAHETQNDSDPEPAEVPAPEEVDGDESDLPAVDGDNSDPGDAEEPSIEETPDVPVVYTSSNCGIGSCSCTGSCRAVFSDYSYQSETLHSMTVSCSGCGAWALGGGSERHSFSGNTCTKCGYSKACPHSSTTKKWITDCKWKNVCNSCGETISSGTTHGPYDYGSWSYYNATQHRRSYTCTYGDSGTYYETANHSTTTKYEQHNATQHAVSSYCATCSSAVGTTTYANHTFTYGGYETYSSTQHRRLRTCTTCGYSEYVTTSHSLSYGPWEDYSTTQHRRTVTCSTCGYSGYGYASHTHSYGGWASITDQLHQRTGTCTCGNQSVQQEAHTVSYGAWASISDQQHQRTGNCACGYQTTQQADHSLIYTPWSVASEEAHKRTGSCSCGHEATEEASHTDTDDDGYCDDCAYLVTRFSVTVPVSLAMTVSQHGEVHAATNAAIVNNSTGAVEVTSMTVTAENGWTLVPYSTDMSGAKVDAKQIGFALNDAETLTNGRAESLFLSRNWTIAKGGSLALLYDAVVSAVSAPVNEQVLTLVFVVDWAR